MVWYADINLKSGNNVVVDNLVSINKCSALDGSVTKVSKFEDFHLYQGQRLTFVGEKAIVTLISDEILYIEFKQHD